MLHLSTLLNITTLKFYHLQIYVTTKASNSSTISIVVYLANTPLILIPVQSGWSYASEEASALAPAGVGE